MSAVTQVTPSYFAWKEWEPVALAQCDRATSLYFYAELFKLGFGAFSSRRVLEICIGNGSFLVGRLPALRHIPGLRRSLSLPGLGVQQTLICMTQQHR